MAGCQDTGAKERYVKLTAVKVLEQVFFGLVFFVLRGNLPRGCLLTWT